MSLSVPLQMPWVQGVSAAMTASLPGVRAMSHGGGSFHAPFGSWGATPPSSHRGWRSFSGLRLEASSFRSGDLTDSLIETAFKRLGPSLSDALLVVDETLFEDERHQPLLDSLHMTDAAERRKLLSLLSEEVRVRDAIDQDDVDVADFQILRWSENTSLPRVHMHKYWFFQHDHAPIVMPFAHYATGVSRELRRHLLKSDITAMGGYLESLQYYLGGLLDSGHRELDSARGVALSLEASARQLDLEFQGDGDPIVDANVECAFDMLWQCLDAARNVLLQGHDDRGAFGRMHQSLLHFVMRNVAVIR